MKTPSPAKPGSAPSAPKASVAAAPASEETKTGETIRIFNQGARAFKIYGILVNPGRFSDIPVEHAEHVEKLLKDYPTELVTDKAAKAVEKAKDERIKVLEAQVAELTEANRKLQLVVSGAKIEDAAAE